MPPTPSAPSSRPRRPVAAALALAVALFVPLACGGEAGGGAEEGAGDAAEGSTPAAEASAADAGAETSGGTEASDGAVGAADGDAAGGGEADGDASDQEGEAGHTHGDDTHTHAAADTLSADVTLDPGPGAGWTGSATLLAVGDSVRVLVSVEGAEAGARLPAELLAGSCAAPGPTLATLPPVAAGSSGAGSSQGTVAAPELGDRAHGVLRLGGGGGGASACAEVHLGDGHEHADG